MDSNQMPTATGGRFTTATIERRRGREASAEEAMVEMHLAGAPARRTEEAGEVFVSTAKSTKADADENPTKTGRIGGRHALEGSHWGSRHRMLWA